MTQKSQAQHVVDLFGGHSKMAGDTMYKYQAIRRWLSEGVIHPKNYPGILGEAQRLGVEMTRADFVAHLPEN